MTQYCPLLALPNQTSQEVTHSGTAFTEARLMWDVTITPSWDPASPLATPCACARSHYLRLDNDSDTICNDTPSMTQYCPLLAPSN